MRYRFHTLSAAIYVIDTDNMTWERRTPQPQTPELVLGLTTTRGELSDEPVIHIGRRCHIPIWLVEDGIKFGTMIHTTQVQRIELLDADPE
jgi:chemotaxis signal transduction protein